MGLEQETEHSAGQLKCRTNAGYRGTLGAVPAKACCEDQVLRMLFFFFSVIGQGGRSLCSIFAGVVFYANWMTLMILQLTQSHSFIVE